MAGEKNDNNMKIAVTIIIVLATLLAVAVFALQQKKNSDGTASTAPTTSESATGDTQTEAEEDAGSLGKNEVKLADDNFKAEVEDYKGVVLVDFYLATCPHCQNIAKDVTAVSDELAGKVKVGKLDARANSGTSDKYKIESVPTFIIFKDGAEAERVTGEKTKQQLIDMANKYLK